MSDTDNLATAAEAFHDTAKQLRQLAALQGRSYPQAREAVAHAAGRLAVAQHRLDALQDEVVTALYMGGADWNAIGAALGVSRQAAHKRYAALMREREARTILGAAWRGGRPAEVHDLAVRRQGRDDVYWVRCPTCGHGLGTITDEHGAWATCAYPAAAPYSNSRNGLLASKAAALQWYTDLHSRDLAAKSA